jgi:hypothetical protein
MAQFDKLTDGEYKRLAKLGKEVRRIRTVTDEDVYWTFIGTKDGNFIEAALPEKARDTLFKGDGNGVDRIEANKLNIKRWEEAGYIALLPSQSGSFFQFLLTPRGIDYLSYRAKWGIIRWLIDA